MRILPVSFAVCFALLIASTVYADTIETGGRSFPGKGKKEVWLSAVAIYNEGNSLARAEKWDQAIEKYKAAAEKYPYDSAFFSNMGAAYRNKGDLKSAATALRNALKIEPLWQTWANLGDVLRRQGLEQEARQAFQSALDANPPEPYKGVIEKDIINIGGH